MALWRQRFSSRQQKHQNEEHSDLFRERHLVTKSFQVLLHFAAVKSHEALKIKEAEVHRMKTLARKVFQSLKYREPYESVEIAT